MFSISTHSSVLSWRIPGTGEPGGLPSTGLNRIGHDWCDLAAVSQEKPFFYPHTHRSHNEMADDKVEETFRFFNYSLQISESYCHMSSILPLTVQLVISSFLPKPQSLAITVSYLAILFWPYSALSFYEYHILIKILIYLESRYHVSYFYALNLFSFINLIFLVLVPLGCKNGHFIYSSGKQKK